MRTLIPLLLLAVFSYAGWYYWQDYTDRPLRENILLTDPADITRARVTDAAGDNFQFLRIEGTENWAVKRGITELYDQTPKVLKLLEALAVLRTDSVMRRFPTEGVITIQLEGGALPETLELYLPGPGEAPLARAGAAGDVYALQPASVQGLAALLQFEAYRERRLLNLLAARVDSITATNGDSLLWQLGPPEVTPLAKALIAPAAAPYADYFDEIMHRDKYFATLNFYAQGEPHRIQVFQDSLWPKPFVLVGEDFPRRFLALDNLR